MEAYRQIITGDKLADVIDLPENLKKSELEIIIMPVEQKEKETKKTQTIKLEDLPSHNLGRELLTVDREHIYANER
jgi:hypothetical protein